MRSEVVCCIPDQEVLALAVELEGLGSEGVAVLGPAYIAAAGVGGHSDGTSSEDALAAGFCQDLQAWLSLGHSAALLLLGTASALAPASVVGATMEWAASLGMSAGMSWHAAGQPPVSTVAVHSGSQAVQLVEAVTARSEGSAGLLLSLQLRQPSRAALATLTVLHLGPKRGADIASVLSVMTAVAALHERRRPGRQALSVAGMSPAAAAAAHLVAGPARLFVAAGALSREEGVAPQELAAALQQAQRIRVLSTVASAPSGEQPWQPWEEAMQAQGAARRAAAQERAALAKLRAARKPAPRPAPSRHPLQQQQHEAPEEEAQPAAAPLERAAAGSAPGSPGGEASMGPSDDQFAAVQGSPADSLQQLKQQIAVLLAETLAEPSSSGGCSGLYEWDTGVHATAGGGQATPGSYQMQEVSFLGEMPSMGLSLADLANPPPYSLHHLQPGTADAQRDGTGSEPCALLQRFQAAKGAEHAEQAAPPQSAPSQPGRGASSLTPGPAVTDVFASVNLAPWLAECTSPALEAVGAAPPSAGSSLGTTAGASPIATAGGKRRPPPEVVDAPRAEEGRDEVEEDAEDVRETLLREQRLNSVLLSHFQAAREAAAAATADAAAAALLYGRRPEAPLLPGVEEPADFDALLAALRGERLRCAELAAAAAKAEEGRLAAELAHADALLAATAAAAQCRALQAASPLATSFALAEAAVGRAQRDAHALREENASLARLLADAELLGPLADAAAAMDGLDDEEQRDPQAPSVESLQRRLSAVAARARRLEGEAAALRAGEEEARRDARHSGLHRRQAEEGARRCAEQAAALARSQRALQAQSLQAAEARAGAQVLEDRLGAAEERAGQAEGLAEGLQATVAALRRQADGLLRGRAPLQPIRQLPSPDGAWRAPLRCGAALGFAAALGASPH